MEKTGLDKHSEDNLRFNRSAKIGSGRRWPELSNGPLARVAKQESRPASIGTSASANFTTRKKALIDHMWAKVVDSSRWGNQAMKRLVEHQSQKNKVQDFCDFGQSIDLNKIDFSLLTPLEMMRLACDDKQVSLAFQEYIVNCSQNICTNYILPGLLPVYHSLMTHCIGNYAVQKLLIRSIEFRAFVSSYATDNFKALSSNEFSSRCLQVLVEIDSGFRLMALRKFEADLDGYLSRITAVFILVSAIKHSKSFAEIQFVQRVLRSYPTRYVNSKSFKRVLITYCEICPQKELDSIFTTVRSTTKFKGDLLCEKYTSFFYMVLLERGHSKSWSVLSNLAMESLDALYNSNYFLFVVSKLISRGNPDAIMKLQGILLKCWSKMQTSFNLRPEISSVHCYLISQTFQPGQEREFQQFSDSLSFKDGHACYDRSEPESPQSPHLRQSLLCGRPGPSFCSSY